MKKKSVGRPKKEPDEILVELPFKVAQDTIETVEQIADQLDRPRGWVARKLLLRGISVYLRDVKTMRPEDAIQGPDASDENTDVDDIRSPAQPRKMLTTPLSATTRKKGGNK
jgi:hypothetical protein